MPYRKKWRQNYIPPKIKASELLQIAQIFRDLDLVAEIKQITNDQDEWKKFIPVIRYVILELALVRRPSLLGDRIGKYKGFRYELKSFGGNSGVVWGLDILGEDNSSRSFVLKNIRHAGTMNGLGLYFSGKEKYPLVVNYQPKLYGVLYEWQIADKLFGFGTTLKFKDLKQKIKEDEAFRCRYAKAIFDLYFFVANTDLMLGDITSFIESLCFNNFVVNPETAEIKVVEYGSLLLCASIDKPILPMASKMMAWVKGELHELHTKYAWEKIPEEKIDLAFQFVKWVFIKIHPNDLRMKGYRLHTAFVQAIYDNDIEAFTEAISKNTFLDFIS